MMLGVLHLQVKMKNSMITVVNYLHKGRWYGCADDAGNAFGYYGFGGSSIDNSQPSDDLCIGAIGFGRPKVGKGSGDGIFCGSGIYSNCGKRKA